MTAVEIAELWILRYNSTEMRANEVARGLVSQLMNEGYMVERADERNAHEPEEARD